MLMVILRLLPTLCVLVDLLINKFNCFTLLFSYSFFFFSATFFCGFDKYLLSDLENMVYISIPSKPYIIVFFVTDV
jgi:hypothetical protein